MPEFRRLEMGDVQGNYSSVESVSANMAGQGGKYDKIGNQYESVWTTDVVIDVFLGKFLSIAVEAVGQESEGVEFHLETIDRKLQFHSVKRQKQGGDWSVAKFCQRDASTGRSILGDLFNKRRAHHDCELRFISATGANELRELTERAEAASNVIQYRRALSATLQSAFDERIVPLCDNDCEFALAALTSLEVVPRSHKDLNRTVERRIQELFYRRDGSDLRPDDVRRMIAEYVLSNVGKTLTTADIRDDLQKNGLSIRDWKVDLTVRDIVAKTNKRYLSVVETELINATQIAREQTEHIIAAISDPASNGALMACF
jgi:hypothetical protein